MAQIKTTQQGNIKSVLLIDDISSELDASHQEIILNELANLSVQTFITSTDNLLADIANNNADLASSHLANFGEFVFWVLVDQPPASLLAQASAGYSN